MTAGNLLLSGARGQLARDIAAFFPSRGWTVHARDHRSMDVTDLPAVRAALEDSAAAVLINTAAYHRVDVCEDNPAPSFAVNASAVRDMAALCAERGVRFVHFSTDYVFGGGPRPEGDGYAENDLPAPVNLYGVSKRAGERLALLENSDALVLRVAGLYGRAGSSGKGGNFVHTMLRLGREGKPVRVVDDQVTTPTSTRSLARALASLLETDISGIVHLSAEGSCSWHGFADAIFEIAGMDVNLSPCASDEFPTRARRPGYSVLRNARMKSAGLAPMPHWRDALEEYLRTAED